MAEEFTKKNLLFFPFFFFFSFFLQSPTEGIRLLEFFSVRMDNIDKEHPGELYGRIQVIPPRQRNGYYDVYNRKRWEWEPIGPNEVILLKDPGHVNQLKANDGFTFDVELKDRDFTSDDQVSYGRFNDQGLLWDKNTFIQINGTYGAATLNYMYITDGVITEVEVTLVKANNNRISTIVRGELGARNSNFTSENLLFRKKPVDRENILVIPGARIPLSRTIVCLPKSSASLIIRANLSGYDIITRSSFEIAKGNAVFPVAVSGSSVQSIKGQNGEIQVKVNWGLYWG